MNSNRCVMVLAASVCPVVCADVWSPMEFYIGLGNPQQGQTQKAGSAWTFRRGAFNGELLTGKIGAVTCEPGFGIWGTPSGDYGFIPEVGPRLSPDESLDEGTGIYTPEFDGLLVIPGTSLDACLVFTADGPATVPPLTLKAEMVYETVDGVLVSVKTRIGGVTTTWLDKGVVPVVDPGYTQWTLFEGQGPTLKKGDQLWVQVNINKNISGDWVNISLESVGCYPDFTGDGTLDLFDFLGYVNEFNAGGGSADCDGDGALTLFDFLCFVNAFNAGC